MTHPLQQTIEDCWDQKETLSPDDLKAYHPAILDVLSLLDQGKLRICEKQKDTWITHQWLKKAVLLSFQTQKMSLIKGGPIDQNGATAWWDKVPNKFANWSEADFTQANFRAVPTATVRQGAYVGPKTVLMPCFVNIGAYIDEGTMIDTWATVGSCAQIGKNVHLSGGAGIGGVLEPLQANPVIIEDNVFIGARSEVAEGVIIEEGAVLSMGVFLSASSKIIDRETGEIYMGRVPAYSVVVPGSLPGKKLPDGRPGPHLSCAVIVKKVDKTTREKTSVNVLLRNC